MKQLNKLSVLLITLFFTACSTSLYEHKAVYTEKGFKRVSSSVPLKLNIGDTVKVVTRH